MARPPRSSAPRRRPSGRGMERRLPRVDEPGERHLAGHPGPRSPPRPRRPLPGGQRPPACGPPAVRSPIRARPRRAGPPRLGAGAAAPLMARPLAAGGKAAGPAERTCRPLAGPGPDGSRRPEAAADCCGCRRHLRAQRPFLRRPRALPRGGRAPGDPAGADPRRRAAGRPRLARRLVPGPPPGSRPRRARAAQRRAAEAGGRGCGRAGGRGAGDRLARRRLRRSPPLHAGGTAEAGGLSGAEDRRAPQGGGGSPRSSPRRSRFLSFPRSRSSPPPKTLRSQRRNGCRFSWRSSARSGSPAWAAVSSLG